MLRRLVLRFVFLGLVALVWSGASRAQAEFPLRNNDVWVMAGDSITAQHQHSNYFEAFCFARYPNLKFAFRNSGVGGHTIPTTLARFDYDIAGWKPTVVSVELGMNDQGGTPTDKFVANMQTFVDRINAIKARPVILSASPVNDGVLLSSKSGRNVRLNEYAIALKEVAAKNNIPYADQFHRLVDLWAVNKPYETLANTLPALQSLAKDDKVAGVEHLRAFLTANEKQGAKYVSMQGDPVHPGPNGQLMMAAALLQELGAEAKVSSVTLDAEGKLVEATGCQVDGIKAEGDKLSFDRLDERLPFPIPDGTIDVLPMLPTIEELSQYQLAVRGLKPGTYQVRIGNEPLNLTFTADDLAKGVNLTRAINAVAPNKNASNPLANQGRGILTAVAQKAGLVGQWRSRSKQLHEAGAGAESRTDLATLEQQILAADEKIRETAKPQKLHFELSRLP